jgi:hypothetical protein
MPVHHPWQRNLVAVGPPGALHVPLQRASSARTALERAVRALPEGAPIVISAAAPGAMGRCRAFAAHAGIEVRCEYLAFPSPGAPAYLVEDAPGPVRLFIRNVLVAPPGSRMAAPLEACFAVLRALAPWRLLRTVAPGRVVVGRRA